MILTAAGLKDAAVGNLDLVPGPRSMAGNAGKATVPPDTRYRMTLATDRISTKSACLAAALSYAALDLKVFPLTAKKTPTANCWRCKPGAGCPGRMECLCPASTCHGFYAATTDLVMINRWWTRHPDWQLGIRTGAESGLVVLDVDLDKGRLDTLIGLQRAGLDIKGTDAQLSGSGSGSGSGNSFHLFYRHPGGYVKCSVGSWSTGLGRGVDVRGDLGYIVAAPSLHARTGMPYELLGGLTDLPVWPFPIQPETLNPVAQIKPVKPVTGSGGTGRRLRTQQLDVDDRTDGAHVRQRPPMHATTIGALTAGRVASWADSVRNAEPGRRREALFWAACRLAESTGIAQDRLDAATSLYRAAIYNDMSEGKAFSTIHDALGRLS